MKVRSNNGYFLCILIFWLLYGSRWCNTPNNKMRSLRENYKKGYALDTSTRKVAMQWGMSPKEIENVNNGVLLTPHQKGVNATW